MAELPERGPIIGLAGLPPIPPGELFLAPGDKLLAISDGLADSRDAKGESFGEERIAAIAAANARESVDVLVTALRRAADDFRQAAPPRDDLSLLGVEFIRPKG